MENIYANWYDENAFDNSIQNQVSHEVFCKMLQDDCGDWYIIDNDEKSEYIDITYYEIYTQKCNCSKYINVILHEQAHQNSISYCKECGRENWSAGAFEYETIDSPTALEAALEAGYILSEEDRKILEQMNYV